MRMLQGSCAWTALAQSEAVNQFLAAACMAMSAMHAQLGAVIRNSCLGEGAHL